MADNPRPRSWSIVIVIAIFVFLAVAALAGGLAYTLYFSGGSSVSIGGPFTLVDQRGETRRDSDFRGRYMLVYFGYTFCPDICPTTLQSMITALDGLDPDLQERVTPVLITIDPERDTPERLAEYVASFHPRLQGLTGRPEQVAAAARAYRIYFAKAAGDGSTTDYLMDHSSIIFLMDPKGAYVTHFSHQTTPQQMAAALADKVGG